VFKKHFDEQRFRELYGLGYSYKKIGRELGISTVSTISKYVKILDLPERDSLLLKIDVEKFREEYLEGISICQLSRDFGIATDTVGRVVKHIGLPERLCKNNPHVALKPINVESESPDVKLHKIDGKKIDDNFLHEIDVNPVVDEKKIIDDFKRHKTNFFIAPTLKELEIKNRKAEMIKAESDYKNRGRVTNRLTRNQYP